MIKSAQQSSIQNDIKYRSMSAGNVPSNEYLIQTVVVDATPDAVITFDTSGLSGIYRHLKLVCAVRSTRSATNENMRIQFNNDTGANYSRHQLWGRGSTPVSEAATSQTSAFVATVCAASNTANSFTAVSTDILDPFHTSKNTTVRTLHGSYDWTEVGLTSGAWFNTSEITEIDLVLQSGGSFAQYSRFSLYGVTA